MPTPLQRFHHDLQQPHFHKDPAQAMAVEHMHRLYENIKAINSNTDRSKPYFIKRLLKRNAKPKTPLGLYFWGGVGRGKTYLMDLLFECLPTDAKLRTHFHPFMRDIHQQLDRHKGIKNPLDAIADQYAAKYKIICFDEFFVNDITDAMILAGLLQAFIHRHIIFVATSNIAPAHLYENGLQRQRFLPAIHILEEHTQVINVDNGTDYRLRTLSQANLFHYPLSAAAHQHLLNAYHTLCPDSLACSEGSSNAASHVGPSHQNTIKINDRDLHVYQRHREVIWFDFIELCEKPRSQNDYLVLASQFRTLIISNVPALNSDKDDAARRFIHLIDVCYDASVKLIISADIALANLYTGNHLSFPFQRTVSRLQEMQSEAYLALPHQPPTSMA